MAQDPRSLAPVIFDTAKDLLAWKPSMTNPLLAATVPLAKRVPTSDVQLLAGLDNGDWAYWSKFDGNPHGGHLGNPASPSATSCATRIPFSPASGWSTATVTP
jgi:hypothetical protein